MTGGTNVTVADKIKANGGILSDNYSKVSTNVLLIAKEGLQNTKVENARQRGIPIITYQAFMKNEY